MVCGRGLVGPPERLTHTDNQENVRNEVGLRVEPGDGRTVTIGVRLDSVFSPRDPS